jgi:hypothetical protein
MLLPLSAESVQSPGILLDLSNPQKACQAPIKSYLGVVIHHAPSIVVATYSKPHRVHTSRYLLSRALLTHFHYGDLKTSMQDTQCGAPRQILRRTRLG